MTRRFALRAGELLGIGGDVFMLTVEELLAALTGGTAAYQYIPTRRDAYRGYRELLVLPGVIVGRFDPFAWAADPLRDPALFVAGGGAAAPPAPDDSVVVGHAGAAGRVEGTVRRLDRYAEAGKLQPGEILVTQLTNIGWTPLFPRAAAIVTDLGAPLSHAAIVARELGIPAVVGCGDATVRLRRPPRGRRSRWAGQRTSAMRRPHRDGRGVCFLAVSGTAQGQASDTVAGKGPTSDSRGGQLSLGHRLAPDNPPHPTLP